MSLTVTVIIWLTFIFGSVFLFKGGLGYYSPEWLTQLWQLGHIGLLLVGGTAFLRTFRPPEERGFYRAFIPLCTTALIFAFATEIIQESVGRAFSISDIARDMLGAGMAYTIYTRQRWMAVGKYRLFPALVGFVLVVGLTPFATAVAFELRVRNAFPIIADFEQDSELRKCSGNVSRKLSSEAVGLTNRSLRVTFGTSKYSGVTLKNFPQDWRTKEWFTFSAYLPQEHFELNLKIHDIEHSKQGTKFSDRFNKTINLRQGVNKIRIPLAEIAKAPKGREMDLGEIIVVQLFVMGQKEKNVVFLDDFMLE